MLGGVAPHPQTILQKQGPEGGQTYKVISISSSAIMFAQFYFFQGGGGRAAGRVDTGAAGAGDRPRPPGSACPSH